jgi:phosphoserine phosphatase
MEMNWFMIVIALVAVGAGAWLVTAGVWWLVRGFGHATGLDERVDRFLDVDGGMDTMDYVRLRERHRGGGAS